MFSRVLAVAAFLVAAAVLLAPIAQAREAGAMGADRGAGAPPSPSAVTAVAGDHQATVSFTLSYTTIPITYTVYVQAVSLPSGAPALPGGNVPPAYPLVTASGGSSPIVVTGLVPGAYYFFDVWVTNADGTSPTISGGGVTIPPDPTVTPPAPAPAVSPGPLAEPANVAAGQTQLVSVLAPGPVKLGVPNPALALTVTLVRGMRVTLNLLDADGHVLAQWHEQPKAGTHKLLLKLPKTARHRGHDKLRITSSGGTKTLMVLVA